MSSRAVCCLAESEQQAHSILEQMRKSGFSGAEVSVLVPGTETKPFLREPGSADIVSGWLADSGTIALEGIGSAIAAGPLRAAFQPAGTDIAAALAGVGIPAQEGKRYEMRMKQGGVLISVQSDDPQLTDLAMAICEHAGIHDFSLSNADADEEKLRTDSF